ncbi:ferritin-like domain-containing protein [Actinomadura sp. 6N118]|uniref:ferritin-like domain-containing protein n=1 Tax=Actinomadura sp. 6N118 TaxID=3375151 RepID=UPI0037A00D65
MSRIARELVEGAGLDVNVLTGKLTAAAGDELATFYHYAILSCHSVGLTDDGLREIIRDIRAEDLIHFDELTKRVYELDGILPLDLPGLVGRGDLSSSQTPDIRSPDDLIARLLESERRAIQTYTHICDVTAGKDPRTHQLALAILNEEVEHEAWIREFLGEGQGGRFRPGFRGRAPEVRRATGQDLPPAHGFPSS